MASAENTPLEQSNGAGTPLAQSSEAGTSTETAAVQSPESSTEQSLENSTETTAAQSSENSTENTATQPTESSTAHSTENSTENTATPPTENSAAQSTENSAESSATQPTDPPASASTTRPSAAKIAKYTAAGAAAILLLIYLGVSVFFRSHFLFHTTINGQDFSRQTVDDARTYFDGQAAAYTLDIVESGNKTEHIKGSEIGMAWDDDQKLEQLLKSQNAFAWPLAFFREQSEDITFDISCDETALEKKVSSLDAVTAEPIPPQSAYPKFDGNAYIIEPEVYGTDLDSEKLLKEIQQLVLQLENEINLQEEGFYKEPEYTTESEKLKEVCKTLNHYCQASITYEMDEPVVVDKTLISTWLSVGPDFTVTLDEAAVRNWMTEFGNRYDTLGTTRPLTTPTGRATEVSGGTYGWSINEEEEFPILLNSIKNGETLTKAPSCYQTAASHSAQDWGGTFVEVDLTAQHVWYLENGSVVFECDVVTGKNSTITPPGVYTILEKLSPTVLVGNRNPVTGEPEYRTPVSFWMRVTWEGIGLHDATWQPAFGGDVYLWNGSHGCINMPYYSAQELYSILQIGTPVVIHY